MSESCFKCITVNGDVWLQLSDRRGIVCETQLCNEREGERKVVNEREEKREREMLGWGGE